MVFLTDYLVVKLNQAGQKWKCKLGDYLRSQEIVVKTITVNAAATSGTSAGDTTIIGGTVVGIAPTTNADQLVKSTAINATTGVITLTLATAATANNVYNVAVQKAQS